MPTAAQGMPAEVAPPDGYGYHANPTTTPCQTEHKAVWVPNGPSESRDIFMFATPAQLPVSKNTIVDTTRPASARRQRTPLRTRLAEGLRRREPLMPATRGSATKLMVPYGAYPSSPNAHASQHCSPLPSSQYSEADCYDDHNLPNTEAAHRYACLSDGPSLDGIRDGRGKVHLKTLDLTSGAIWGVQGAVPHAGVHRADARHPCECTMSA
jgi:hypothetical protein